MAQLGIVIYANNVFRLCSKGSPLTSKVVLLTFLCEGQEATILQLPAQSRIPVKAKERESGLIAV
jgi:hypothetical protein